MSMKRKKVGHEQGLSVQLSIVGHFFLDAPPQRNCLGTSLLTRIFKERFRSFLQSKRGGVLTPFSLWMNVRTCDAVFENTKVQSTTS